MTKQDLKPEHATVLRTLEAACLAHRRVVSVGEIVQAFLNEDADRLSQAYANDLPTTVTKILGMLHTRGIVFSPGLIGSRRYYGSVRVLDPLAAQLPTKQSRRQQVLNLIRDTVTALNRAVRTGDLLEYAARTPSASELTPAAITHDVLSLEDTGEIKVVGLVRGDDSGTKLYLPAELPPERYLPSKPLTWLEEVAQTVLALWDERVAEAQAANRRPRPLSTSDVRARLVAADTPHLNLDNPKLMVNAMLQLAQGSRSVPPLIRKIVRQGLKSVLWAPTDVPDEDLDTGDAYTSDVDRISTAVARGVERLGRPVTRRDVADEISMDPLLQPVGTRQLFEILSDSSKEEIDAGNGSRRARVVRRVYWVGRADGEAFYHHRAVGSSFGSHLCADAMHRVEVRGRAPLRTSWRSNGLLAAVGRDGTCHAHPCRSRRPSPQARPPACRLLR